MSAIDDMRLLDQIADEIRNDGVTWTRGGLAKLMTGVMAKRIAKTMEDAAYELAKLKHSSAREFEIQSNIIEGLRSDMATLSDVLMERK